MKTLSMLVISIAAASVTFALTPANAATNPVQKQCSDEWDKMKSDNKVPSGMTWPKFYSQCAADAKTAADTTPAPAKTKAARTVATTDESDTGSSADDKKVCDAKWGDYKARNDAHGWKAYFTFMAKCMP